MKPIVYIETSVIGYLTSRPRADAIVAGHQEATRKWWKTAAARFTLVVSEAVVRECSAGDATAARERLDAMEQLRVLQSSPSAERLTRALLNGQAVPKKYPEDAAHIAIAAAHGVNYLVSWNFRHITNASVRKTIERICLAAGFEPPVICAPDQLLDSNDV